MPFSQYELLEYLHDAKCVSLDWDCSNRTCREMKLRVIANREAGYQPWEGKDLTIVFNKVIAVFFCGWGYMIATENIGEFRQGISDKLEWKCHKLMEIGIHVPELKFSISFSSGSSLEVVCSEVSVVENT